MWSCYKSDKRFMGIALWDKMLYRVQKIRTELLCYHTTVYEG